MSTMQLYGKLGANVFGGEVSGDAGQMDYLSDAIRFTLHTVTYVPNIDTDEAFANASNELGTANGYTANGIAAGTKTVSYNSTGNVTTYDMDDTSITWTASGGTLTFQYVVAHDDTVSTGPPVKPLIGYIDAGAQAITTGNTFLVTTGATGLFTATVT
jgi:hypothetical protein